MIWLRMIGLLILLVAGYTAGVRDGFERGKSAGIDAAIAEIEKQANVR